MKLSKKASLEVVKPDFGASFTIKQFLEPATELNIAQWHFHPEIEMVYVKGGNGRRHIGNHLGYYRKGDLVLIGSNLPHYGFTDRLTGNDSETVIQLRSDFLGESFFESPELKEINQLFERAKFGISFTGKAKYEIGEQLEALPNLSYFHRLLGLLEILHQMAITDEYKLLNAAGYSFEVNLEDNDRPRQIFRYVRKNFLETIALNDIAAEVNMTVPAFCRYFKKLTSKTFTKFVNEYRVVHACKLLSERKMSITEICFESGFNNFSHFTKVFQEITGKKPSHYRKELKEIV